MPESNPFAGSTPGLDEIWSFGLRNPWRISFDRLTGDLWIGDVGQGEVEEIDFQPASSTGGENYGWKLMEGSDCYDPDPIDPDCPDDTESCFSTDFVDPIFEYDHGVSDGGRCVTGGFVYRGCKFPTLSGYYILMDYISSNGWLVDSAGSFMLFSDFPNHISTFGESEQGEIYAGKLEGSIYKVRDGNIPKNLVLDESDSPLSGMYEAEDTIFVQGTVTISPGKTATLISSEVIIENDLTINNTSLIQLERNCQ